MVVCVVTSPLDAPRYDSFPLEGREQKQARQLSERLSMKYLKKCSSDTGDNAYWSDPTL